MTGKKVALSGASGNVGRILRVELQRRGVALRSAGGTKPLEPLQLVSAVRDLLGTSAMTEPRSAVRQP